MSNIKEHRECGKLEEWMGREQMSQGEKERTFRRMHSEKRCQVHLESI